MDPNNQNNNSNGQNNNPNTNNSNYNNWDQNQRYPNNYWNNTPYNTQYNPNIYSPSDYNRYYDRYDNWPSEDYGYTQSNNNWYVDDRYPGKILPYNNRRSRTRMSMNPIGFRADTDTYNRMLKNSTYINNNVSDEEYLVDHIVEELEGANDYMNKALEWKSKDQNVSKKFYKMAETEAEHANCLAKIFNTMKKSEYTSDEDYNKMYKEIIQTYEDEMYKLESAKKLYRS